MSSHTLSGEFLVSTPLIDTPPFERSVIFILEHDDSGAVGVVLNKVTDLLVEDHLPGLRERLTDPPHVFYGGPVSSDTAIALGSGSEANFLRESGLSAVGIVDLEESLEGIDSLRIFAGYAGWEANQIEAEIEEGAWWVLPPVRSDIFTPVVNNMWERSVERAPGAIPLYSTYTKDPSSN